jgi:hypothetical protein
LLRLTGDAPSDGAIQQTLSQHWTQEVARQEEHHVYMVRFEEQEKLEPLLHSKIEYFERCCLEAEERRSPKPGTEERAISAGDKSHPVGCPLGHESQCALIERCEDLRLRRRITQRDLTKEVGVNDGAYSLWRRKKIPPHRSITWHQSEVFTTAISAWCTGQEQAATC